MISKRKTIEKRISSLKKLDLNDQKNSVLFGINLKITTKKKFNGFVIKNKKNVPLNIKNLKLYIGDSLKEIKSSNNFTIKKKEKKTFYFKKSINYKYIKKILNKKKKKEIQEKRINNCNINLTDQQALCYLDRNRFLIRKFKGYDIDKAKEHWKKKGCKNFLKYNCSITPINRGNYVHQGCYNNNKNNDLISDKKFRGNLMQCSKIAEKQNKLIFGVQNDKDCYVGDDLSKAKKMGVNDTCGFRGNKYAFELYQRNPPFEPENNKLSKNDFETFTNAKQDKFNIYLFITIIFILLIAYYFFI